MAKPLQQLLSGGYVPEADPSGRAPYKDPNWWQRIFSEDAQKVADENARFLANPSAGMSAQRDPSYMDFASAKVDNNNPDHVTSPDGQEMSGDEFNKSQSVHPFLDLSARQALANPELAKKVQDANFIHSGAPIANTQKFSIEEGNAKRANGLDRKTLAMVLSQNNGIFNAGANAIALDNGAKTAINGQDAEAAAQKAIADNLRVKANIERYSGSVVSHRDKNGQSSGMATIFDPVTGEKLGPGIDPTLSQMDIMTLDQLNPNWRAGAEVKQYHNDITGEDTWVRIPTPKPIEKKDKAAVSTQPTTIQPEFASLFAKEKTAEEANTIHKAQAQYKALKAQERQLLSSNVGIPGSPMNPPQYLSTKERNDALGQTREALAKLAEYLYQ